MNSAKATIICLSLILLLLPIIVEPDKNHQDFQPLKINYESSAESSGSANFSSSGDSGVAISGEPAHVGDSIRASVFVSNSGNSSGSVKLNLENIDSSETFEGDPVEISPGSTREISVLFSPISNGSNTYMWWISALGGPDPISLEGQFSIDASPKQTIDVAIESFEWDDEDGLVVDGSVYLSNGLPRDVLIKVSLGHQGSLSLLQSLIVEADPGRRALEFNLGQPIADSIHLEVIPIGWAPTGDSHNSSQISVEMPSVDSSSLTVEAQFSPSMPMYGSKVIATISLTNYADFPTKDGHVRIVLSSDRTVLAETSAQSVIPGSTITSDVPIPFWPEGEWVELEIQWSAGEVLAVSYFSIESVVADEGVVFPFDVISAAYGVLGGVLSILVGTLAWRAVTNRTPSTSELGLRDTKESLETRSRVEKSEISCTFCEQRLMIPSNHSGGVRCPSCSMEFRVGEEPQEQMVSKSADDNLNCPECDQALRVPIEKRPVMSRCPVCKVEFLAQTEEGTNV